MGVKNGWLLAGAFLVVVILVSFLFNFQKTEIKNEQSGIIEKGSTLEENATIETSNITNITCEYCQYPFNNTCINYSCCLDSQCQANESCSNNSCLSLNCVYCQHIENHQCVSYECCNNADCGENKQCLNHKCIYINSNECIPYACKDISFQESEEKIVSFDKNYTIKLWTVYMGKVWITIDNGEPIFVGTVGNSTLIGDLNFTVHAAIPTGKETVLGYADLEVCREEDYECCENADCIWGKVCKEYKCLSNNLSTICGNNVCENQTLRLYSGKETAFVINSNVHNFNLSGPGQVSHLFVDDNYEMLDVGNYYQFGRDIIYIKDYGLGFLDLVIGENKNSCPADCAKSEYCGNGICENQTMKIYEGETKSVAIGDKIHKVELESIQNNGGPFLGYILVDDLYSIKVYKEGNYSTNDLDIYVNDIFWTGKEAYRMYAVLTFGENVNTCPTDCNNI